MGLIEDHDLDDVDYEEDPDLWRKARDEAWVQWDAEHVHQDPKKVPLADLEARITRLGEWPRDLGDAANDPRCGCDAPWKCAWDDVTTLEEILGRRRELEA